MTSLGYPSGDYYGRQGGLSIQDDLWGIDLYPAEHGGTGWLEFDSMINVRPRQANRSRYVNDPSIRSQIESIVDRLVRP